MKKCIPLVLLAAVLFSSCRVSNKQIIRQQHLEEGVESPTTVEELKDAIEKYQKRVADIQLAQSQIGIWYKILGTRYLDQKMYGEALKCFQEALQYYPNNQNLYYYVGVCAGYMSHAAMDFGGSGSTEVKYNYLKLAEEAYLRAIQIEDRYVRALYGLGVLYVFELDEPAKAIPHLEKVLSIDTKNIDAMFVLARAYYSNYDFEKSAAMYDKIINTTKSAEKKATAEENKKTVLDAAYSN
ncbi:TPR repeat-containing protein [Treponema bryantii]|uniref:TPR repeat-containing protein n=1 Tax=Treponema bryantii TaxID=163 RepID=A0A1I3M368_9SPIR|nr:tetratricopeptide repeat protein [Treponema bryantii]SFI91367.1 TPR repeat-containing protein [Treponema bryantii]